MHIPEIYILEINNDLHKSNIANSKWLYWNQYHYVMQMIKIHVRPIFITPRPYKTHH